MQFPKHKQLLLQKVKYEIKRTAKTINIKLLSKNNENV